jgi:FKBP-type peptidyl-prolyl cis-trans isomerase
MKKSYAKIALLLTTVAVVSCGKSVGKLDTTEKKFSYTIGQQIGQNLKAQGIKVDTSVLAASIDEALAGKEGRLTPEEMQKVMQDMQNELIEKRKVEGEENIKKAEAYLEANKGKEGVKVTASGLQYKVISEGTGPKPKETDTVEVHYKGTLTDGTEFDSSYKRNQTAKFPVRGVIPGWTEGLQLMSKGAKYHFFIPPGLAYGERGRPSIPPNSVLVFEVELVDITAGEAPAKAAPKAGKNK